MCSSPWQHQYYDCHWMLTCCQLPFHACKKQQICQKTSMFVFMSGGLEQMRSCHYCFKTQLTQQQRSLLNHSNFGHRNKISTSVFEFRPLKGDGGEPAPVNRSLATKLIYCSCNDDGQNR
jgi:hypothetical protein